MELYREGYLNKAGKGLIQTHLHSWRPRFFIFDGKVLKYYKSKDIVDENLLGTIDFAEVESVGLMKGEKKCFQITTKPPKSRTYYMSGKSEDEVMDWVRVFEMGKAKLGETPDSDNQSGELIGPPKPARQNTVPSTYAVLSNTTSESEPAVRSEYNSISDFAFKEDDSSMYEVVNSELKAQTLPARPKPPLPYRSYSQTNPPDSSQGGRSDSAEEPLCEEHVSLYDEIDDNKQKKPIVSSEAEISDLPEVPPREIELSLEIYDLPHEEADLPLEKSDLPEEKDDPISEKPDLPLEKADVTQEEVVSPPMASAIQKVEPMYTKPIRSRSSKKSVAKTQRPGMLDIGEVPQDVEEETAAGAEALKKGMTSPIGERFAIEELRDLLQQFDNENNDNNNAVDFKMNDNESAFSALKRFLDTC